MSNLITKTTAPVLPTPAEQYNNGAERQFRSILRLFFNRLVGTVDRLLSPVAGGSVLYFPFGMFYSTATQTAAIIDTAYPITFNTASFSDRVSIVSNSRVTVEDSGVFTFQVTAHFIQNSAASKEAHIWARKNGADIAYTANLLVIEGSGKQLPAVCVFDITLSAGDYVEFVWGTENTSVELRTYAASAPYPAGPSASVSVTYSSNA